MPSNNWVCARWSKFGLLRHAAGEIARRLQPESLAPPPLASIKTCLPPGSWLVPRQGGGEFSLRAVAPPRGAPGGGGSTLGPSPPFDWPPFGGIELQKAIAGCRKFPIFGKPKRHKCRFGLRGAVFHPVGRVNRMEAAYRCTDGRPGRGSTVVSPNRSRSRLFLGTKGSQRAAPESEC